MEFRHLRYFVVLADELHFGRAAERLAISQPPLSWNIQQLEQSVGAKLFHRNSRGVRLTDAGRVFLPAARALLAQAADAKRLACDAASGIAGVLRVGFVSSMLYRGLPRLMAAFEAQHPHTRLLSLEASSNEQLVALAHGRVDVGFVHTAQLPATLTRFLFAAEPFVCCLPDHHAAAGAASLAPAQLAGETFVMFAREASPDYYERVLNICTSAGFVPDIRHEVRHWLGVVSLVARGLGVALVPRAVRHAAMAGAAFVPLESVAEESRVWCVWRKADDGAALQAFLAAARAVTSAGDAAAPNDW